MGGERGLGSGGDRYHRPRALPPGPVAGPPNRRAELVKHSGRCPSSRPLPPRRPPSQQMVRRSPASRHVMYRPAVNATPATSRSAALCVGFGGVLLLVALMIVLGDSHGDLAAGTAIFGVGLLIAAVLSGREGSSEVSVMASRAQMFESRVNEQNVRISRLNRENKHLRYQLSRPPQRRPPP